LTTFVSRETGIIRLASFGGDAPTPWGAVTKVYLTLYRPHDLRVFTRLFRQHREISYAKETEVGALTFKMRHLDVTGWYAASDPPHAVHVTLRVGTFLPPPQSGPYRGR